MRGEVLYSVNSFFFLSYESFSFFSIVVCSHLLCTTTHNLCFATFIRINVFNQLSLLTSC